MDQIDCKTGCVRLELDENSETLKDTLRNLADEFESADHLQPSQETLARLKADTETFARDLDLFKKKCGKCKQFKGNGKASEYDMVLQEAQELMAILG